MLRSQIARHQRRAEQRRGDPHGRLELVINGSLPDGEREANRVADEKPGKMELFNLAEDISEKQNFASKHPEKVAELRSVTTPSTASKPAQAPPQTRELQVAKNLGSKGLAMR